MVSLVGIVLGAFFMMQYHIKQNESLMFSALDLISLFAFYIPNHNSRCIFGIHFVSNSTQLLLGIHPEPLMSVHCSIEFSANLKQKNVGT